MQCVATAASFAARWCYAATAGLEPGARHGGRHQSFRRADDAAGGAPGMDLRPKQAGILGRDACRGSAAPVALHPVHRVGSPSVSYAQAAAGPQATATSEPSPVPTPARHLAMGVACASYLGSGGWSCHASARDVPAPRIDYAIATARNVDTLTAGGALKSKLAAGRGGWRLLSVRPRSLQGRT